MSSPVVMATLRNKALSGHDPSPVSPLRRMTKGMGVIGGGSAGPTTSLSSLSKLQQRLKQKQQQQASVQARKEVKDIIIYTLFIVFLSTSVLIGRNSSSAYRFKERVVKQFTDVEFHVDHAHVEKNFRDVATVEEWYQWMYGPFLDAAYSSHTFDGDEREGETRPGFILGQDMLVGGIRVGQLRSTAYECDGVPAVMRDNLVAASAAEAEEQFRCFHRFSSSYFDILDDEKVSKEPYAEDRRLCPTDYDYQSPGGCETGELLGPYEWDQPDEPSFLSMQGIDYPPPGFNVVLPNRNATRARQLISTMYESDFVDLHTRVVLVDFTTYNPNHGLFAVVRLLAEMPNTGGVFTSEHNYILRFYQFETASDAVRTTCEVITLCFVLYYIREEFMNLREAMARGFGMEYFKKFTNWAHSLNLWFYVAVVLLRAVTFFFLLPSDYNVAGDAYVSFREAGQWLRLAEKVNAINTLLCWLKVFKYLSFVSKFSQLTDTMKAASGGVSTFAVMAMIVGIGASMAHMIAFGTQIESYRNMTQAAYSLLRSLLGDFDFEELYKADQSIGPIMFVVYIVLSVFVLLNILIVLISDAYSEVQRNLASKQQHFRVGDAIAKTIWTSLVKVPLLGRALVFVQTVVEQQVHKRALNDRHIPHPKGEVLHRALSEEERTEAMRVFHEFDADRSGTIDHSELKQLVAHLNPQMRPPEVSAAVTMYFAELDGDHSDSLSADEFLRFFSYVQNVHDLMTNLTAQGGEADLVAAVEDIVGGPIPSTPVASASAPAPPAADMVGIQMQAVRERKATLELATSDTEAAEEDGAAVVTPETQI